MMTELRCPSCGNRLRKMGAEELYACDGTQSTVYYKFVQRDPVLVACTRQGFLLSEVKH